MALIKTCFFMGLALLLSNFSAIFASAAQTTVTSATASVQSYAIAMASAEELSKNLDAANFTYFANKTSIHDKLGGKTIEASELLTQVRSSMNDFIGSVGSAASLMPIRDQELLSALLKGNAKGLMQVSKYTLSTTRKETDEEKKARKANAQAAFLKSLAAKK
jgi:hypothetical protein